MHKTNTKIWIEYVVLVECYQNLYKITSYEWKLHFGLFENVQNDGGSVNSVFSQFLLCELITAILLHEKCQWKTYPAFFTNCYKTIQTNSHLRQLKFKFLYFFSYLFIIYNALLLVLAAASCSIIMHKFIIKRELFQYWRGIPNSKQNFTNFKRVGVLFFYL